MLGRRPFRDLVHTQLDLFCLDEAQLLDEAREAEAGWRKAGRDEAEEVYGDWQLIADAIGERLLDLRETYAAALAENTADGYRGSFDRAAAKRLPRFVGMLER